MPEPTDYAKLGDPAFTAAPASGRPAGRRPRASALPVRPTEAVPAITAARRAAPESGHDAETGRGLAIIDDFTGQNWGWWPTPRSGGKVVWAALPAPCDSHDGTHDPAC